MFMVYWTRHSGKIEHDINAKGFGSNEMLEALDFMNKLREDDDNMFVVMASANPNQVGKMGVTQVGPDYNWTKRRNNERKFNSNDAVEVPMDEE